ncbi:hypothetical protein ACF9IK_33550 [Kitasatospora hibisci]|uniref:hypothetical protein n=1 Tax=Kitasatospora hibisci TaxID=3369522 RepID=UPI0037548207
MSRSMDFSALSDLAQAVEVLLAGFDPPEGPEEAALREQVLDLAGELRARAEAPVSIAVVGEYSVGKSLLVGTLLGRPDLLAVEERPATGNITVLRLVRGGPGSRTEVAPRTLIRYMSTAQLGSCVGDILTELVDGIEARHPELRARELIGGHNPVLDERGWGAFNSWYPCLWGRPGQGVVTVNPLTIAATHRDAVVELCRIRDALRGQRDLVDSGALDIDSAAVRAALLLPPVEATPDEAPRVESVHFTRAKVAEDGQALRASFPLIERVEQTVFVSPEEWEIGGLMHEHEVQVLDFPGIGAVGSYGRDRNLSRRVLADMHTILVVLHAQRPYSREALSFWDMLTDDDRTPAALADAALVAANLFDRVGAPPAGDGSAPLTDALNGIRIQGGKYVGRRADRIVAVSAVAAIEAYGLGYEGASPETRAVLDRVLAGLRTDPLPHWQETVARLEAQHPGDDWAARLHRYDQDGGLKALRDLLEAHVREHGVGQKAERAQQSKEKLEAALRDLRRRLCLDLVAPSEEYVSAATRFEEIRAVFHRATRQLRQLRDPQDETPEGPLPPSFAEVSRQVRNEVYRWDPWNHLMERACDNPELLVSRSEVPRRSKIGPGAKRDQRQDDSISPDVTVVYQETFQATIDDAVARNLAAVQEWLDAWGAYWQSDCGPLLRWLRDEDDESARLLTEVYQRRRHDVGLLDYVAFALDMAEVTDQLKAALAEDAMPKAADWAADFPAQSRHALPWHHSMKVPSGADDRRRRHPLALAQLRAAMAEAAAARVGDELDRLMDYALAELTRVFADASRSLLSPADFRAPLGAPDGAEERPLPQAVRDIDDILREWNEGDA